MPRGYTSDINNGSSSSHAQQHPVDMSRRMTHHGRQTAAADRQTDRDSTNRSTKTNQNLTANFTNPHAAVTTIHGLHCTHNA